jgi:multidrug efflux pump subunit AcrA (membrane-fusion protein)
MLSTAPRWLAVAVVLAGVAVLAGCADGGYGDPGGAPLASGQSCGSIRQELDQLDRRGTQGKVEAASQGKKLTPKDKGDVDRYNSLLNQYLGARCHA